ncbi:hypothetical protein DYY65_08270 [Nitrososphaera sp. AFS]|nr:hypothetical protein [Nitrososphaera sp. AFS]
MNINPSLLKKCLSTLVMVGLASLLIGFEQVIAFMDLNLQLLGIFPALYHIHVLRVLKLTPFL